MASDYTLKNVDDIADVAPDHGMAEVGEARSLTKALEGEYVGASFYRMKPGKRHGFGHRHEAAEEMYLVVEGSGRAKVGDDVVDLATLDALRVAPPVMREFEAGPQGMTLLAFGQHIAGDGEMVQGFWPQGG